MAHGVTVIGGTALGTEPEPLQPALLEALQSLIFAAVGLTAAAIADAASGDLTLQQWRALVVVGRATGLRVGDVAARIGMSLPSASRLVARLEERGYVATARDERDRRGTLVTLTPTGAQVRGAVIARRATLMAAALGDERAQLSPSLSGDLASLARAFERYS